MTSHGSGGARASTSAMRLFLLACACLLAAFLTPPLHAQTEDNAPEGGVKTDKDLEICILKPFGHVGLYNWPARVRYWSYSQTIVLTVRIRSDF